MRARSNYLLMSEPMVLAPYRARNWIENKLVDAIIRALRGYLPTEFFHDIFGRVIPLSRGVLQKARARHPASVAALRAEWKDKFVKVMPDALRWSGLLYLHADRRRKLWWLGAPGFKVDRKVEPWDTDDPWSNGKIGMYRPLAVSCRAETSSATLPASLRPRGRPSTSPMPSSAERSARCGLSGSPRRSTCAAGILRVLQSIRPLRTLGNGRCRSIPRTAHGLLSQIQSDRSFEERYSMMIVVER